MATQDVTTNTAGLAPYAMPYIADLYGRTGALLGQEFQPYQGERIAQFSDLQNQAFDAAAALRTSPYLDTAGNMAQLAGLAALNTSYTPGQITAQQISAPSAAAGRVNAPANVSAERVSAPTVRDLSMQAAQSSYDPTKNLQQYQMGPAERVGTERFIDPTNAQDYMSPYMQQVVEMQQRDAQRQADIAATERNAAAVRSGAAGGTRQAILAAEAARNLAQQKGDIQATGLQKSFEQAQAQFNADQLRSLSAQQANQGAGLTVGAQNLAALLGVQGLGANLGSQFALQNLSNQQAANLANLQAGLSTQQLGVTSGLQAQQLNQEAALRAALANQQTGLSAGSLNAQLATQAALTNAQLANQANIANQGANLNAQQLSEASRQFGAGLGMQGINAGLNAAGTLGNIGNLQFNQQTGAIGLQGALGTQQQQLAQNLLNQQYTDYQQQVQYPWQQLSNAASIYGGFPMGSSSSTTQYGSPSWAQTMAGLGMTAAGIGSMFPSSTVKSAAGGQIKAPRSAGLADLIMSKLA